ncbi:MAG: ABC transporter permease [Candidatus Aminicenantaceae bacterium]
MYKKSCGGAENPLGRTINFDKKDWKITGVFKNIPHTSHLPKFQIVTLLQFPDWASGWDGLRVPTYIKVNTGSNINELH